MQFDKCSDTQTNFEVIQKKYEKSGYTMPQLIYWNVNSENDNVPVTMHDKNVALVSGYSPTIFNNLIGNKDMSPMSIMLDVLTGERYKNIKA